MSAMLLDLAPAPGGLTLVAIVVLLLFVIGVLAVTGVVVFLVIRRKRSAGVKRDPRQ